MIAIITYEDKDPITGRKELFVSHGVNVETLENVVMENCKLSDIKEHVGFDTENGIGYYLK